MVEFWSVLIGHIGKKHFELNRLPKVKEKSAKKLMKEGVCG